MKRKTNLFYNLGTDSNFITFSNYPESMTGNFLSVHTKLFPIAFLCINVPSLKDRKSFISFLVSYYENKLAFLRDACQNNNYNIEETIKPLSYLLDAFNKYFGSENWNIAHIGQITEQDYNGVYTDAICIIDSTEHKKVTCLYGTSKLELSEQYTDSTEFLYGWYIKSKDDELLYTGPKDYESNKPVFDHDLYYDYDSHFTGIRIEDNINSTDNIVFNIIVPLYDVINTKHSTDTLDLDNSYIDLTANNLYTHYVPYGIWFSGEKAVELDRSNEKYKPCWSLTISSQFKPFPYSEQKISEIDQTARTASFTTFAQLLTRQNELIDKFDEFDKQFKDMNNRLIELESSIKNFGTLTNIDKLNKQLNSLQTQINKITSELKA